MSEENLVRRVHDHLLIHDIDGAVKEGRKFYSLYPDSELIHTAYLEALCRKGEEMEALKEFSLLKEQSEDKRRLVSEWLAWGVLSKGEASPLLLIRLYALLGAAFTHDVRALPIFLKELRGSNAFLRSLAVKLCVNYGDAPLRLELLRLLKEERVWFVRLEVIRAVGALRMEETRKVLQDIVTHPKTLAEEKAAAILSLVSMYDKVSEEELTALLTSNRGGLRQLGSEIIAYFDLKEESERLIPLSQDPSSEVRISAMTTLGFLQAPVPLSSINPNLASSSPDLSITAAWLATVLGYKEGPEVLRKWIDGERVEPKRLAAAALAATGAFGSSLAIECLRKQKDPYVRVNLAIALIGQRKEVSFSSEVLFQALKDSGQELWMWDEEVSSFFRGLAPSKIRHVDQIPRYPQVIDQLTKLDILSILCIVKHPKALDAVKDFLRNQDYGVTGAAAATLLQEGDDSCLTLVRELLEDPDEKVRMQAALILATLGADPSASKVLMEAYPKAGKDMKVHILEALGHIGDPSSMPFLIEILKEPFQGLRVVAASALIQCLYH